MLDFGRQMVAKNMDAFSLRDRIVDEYKSFATSFTTFVTIDTSSLSLPTFDPMSGRSMCGHERFSSSASQPCA